MDPKNFVIGKGLGKVKYCKIGDIVKHLKSSPSFHMFHDKISDFALELDTGRGTVKKLKDDYRLSIVTLTDVVHDLIEEWVTRTGNNATLHEIIRALNEIGLNSCSELLQKNLVVKDNEEAETKVKKYDRVPPILKEFLNGPSKFCIVSTLDCEITCEKLCENWTNYTIYDWKGFIGVASTPWQHGKSTVDIIKNCTLNNLKQLKKVRGEAHMKVVFVTCEDEQSVKEVVEELASWKDTVEICADLMDWEDLTWAVQEDLLEKLKDLYTISFEEVELNGQVLTDVINGKTIKLFKDTLPKEISYYVDRRVLTRCVISSKVFEKSCRDIFLFTGMERYELSNRANKALTDTSSNQIRQSRLTVRYMIMDQPSHFANVSDRASTPVHLLNYDKGQLRWIKSRGGIGEIQDFIDKSQDELTEEEFCKIISTETKEAICISDSPGMGKSVLLAQIGRRLEKIYPERTVLFVVISELINLVKATGTDDKHKTSEHVLKSIVCENVVGEVVLSSKLHQLTENEIAVELLLDGFDEVGSADEKLAYGILHTIRESFKSVRMWITSRPHLLRGLENHLGVLGYNIQPFSEQDQKQFLTSFWSHNAPVNASRIDQFAHSCLSSLKSKMNSKDEDIAGVPLQCLLIGEVFEDNALEYSGMTCEAPNAGDIDVGTITGLYQRLLEKKFKKFTDLYGEVNFDQKATMDMHVRLSLELIFPEQFSKLEELLEEIEMEKVLKVGIVELTDKTSIKSVRFLHRTFAEYFIAWFIVDRLVPGVGWVDNLTNFLINDVLKVGGDKVGFTRMHRTPRDLKFQGFEYQVINYFIDSTIADKHQIIPDKIIQRICEKPSQSEAIAKAIIFACALGDYVNILKLFSEVNSFHFDASIIFTVDLLILAIFNSGLELVKNVLGQFEAYHELTMKVKIRILIATVKGGKFSTLEFFVKDKERGFREVVKNSPKSSVKQLLHDCVGGTWNNNKSDIEQRIQVLHILVGINQEMLEQKRVDMYMQLSLTPILASGIHDRLIIKLIQLGADVFAKGSDGSTIIHQMIPISKKKYHSILTNIGEDRLGELVQMRTKYGDTPLMCIVKSMNPLPEAINLFNKAGADFNYLDNQRESILSTAIRYQCHTDTLRNLIKHGSDVNWENDKGYTLLHVAAERENIDAVKVLLQEHKMSVNAKTPTGCYTPLDCAIMSDHNSRLLFNVGLFLEENGAKFSDSINSEGQSHLHVAVKKGNETSVRLLLHLKLNINAVDYYGNTPLHYVKGLPLTQFLLDNNANPNAENKLAEKPFHTALNKPYLGHGCLRLLKSKTDAKWSVCLANLYLLATLKVDPYATSDELNWLSEDCAADGVELDWNYRDSNGDTLLHLAANNNNLSAIRYLVEDQKLDIASKNTHQQTVPHVTAMNVYDSWNYVQTVKYLIENGASVFAVDDKNRTFLHILILKLDGNFDPRFPELFDYLVERKCHSLFEVRDCVDGCTPLQLAIYHGLIKDKSRLKILQEGGVNFNILDKKGSNVLSYAIRGWRGTETLSNLIDCGADWKIEDSSGCNLLHISVENNNFKSLKFFLSFGELDISGVDNEGNTPLHCAVQNKNLRHIKEISGFLVDNGAYTNIMNKKGCTPLSLALTTGYRNDSELLQILGGLPASQEDEESNESDFQVINIAMIAMITMMILVSGDAR